MRKTFSRPDNWRMVLKQVPTEMVKLGVDSVGIILIISVFMGVIMTMQVVLNTENPMLPRYTTGLMLRDTYLLEFSSTIMCLLLAGKVGSNIASEIGSMRVSEQIDAMEIMGVNSANYLILPKIVSAVTLTPLLMLLSFMVGLLGGAMIVILVGMINLNQYVEGLHFAFKPFYIYYSMTKISVFGFIITSVAAFYGYYAKGGSLGVGRSSTKAIVISSGLILVFNLVLTKLML